MAVRERIDVTMDEREIIREMYRKYWRYMIEKDADGLRSLMTLRQQFVFFDYSEPLPSLVILKQLFNIRSTLPRYNSYQ